MILKIIAAATPNKEEANPIAIPPKGCANPAITSARLISPESPRIIEPISSIAFKSPVKVPNNPIIKTEQVKKLIKFF